MHRCNEGDTTLPHGSGAHRRRLRAQPHLRRAPHHPRERKGALRLHAGKRHARYCGKQSFPIGEHQPGRTSRIRTQRPERSRHRRRQDRSGRKPNLRWRRCGSYVRKEHQHNRGQLRCRHRRWPRRKRHGLERMDHHQRRSHLGSRSLSWPRNRRRCRRCDREHPH